MNLESDLILRAGRASKEALFPGFKSLFNPTSLLPSAVLMLVWHGIPCRSNDADL